MLYNFYERRTIDKKMNVSEVRKQLSVFDKFQFYSNDHHYQLNEKTIGSSATSLISEYENYFDQQQIAEKCAVKENKTVCQILDQWKEKNEFSKHKGTTCHQYAQSLWNGEQYVEDRYDNSPQYLDAVNKIKKQCDHFYQQYSFLFESVETEKVIGSEEYDICSAVDHIFVNKLTGQVILVDYKTNSVLHGYNDKKSSFTKKMKVPLQDLDDLTINHYYIQLSMYKYMIEKYTEIIIDQTLIVYFSENNDDFEIITVPYLKEQVIKILENRRTIGMNSVPILLIGKSGSGKSTSLRNFKKDEIAVANVLGKPLPFKSDILAPKCDNYETIIRAIQQTDKKVIVIDDANYLITNEFIAKSSIKGYDKYSEMATNFFNLINGIKNVPGNKTVYLIMHEDIDEDGNIKPKTIGRMLDEKVNIQGMFTICIRAIYDNGQYLFRLKTNGQDCVKTPLGMFEQEEMENDLKVFDQKVREYYQMEGEN